MEEELDIRLSHLVRGLLTSFGELDGLAKKYLGVLDREDML